MRFNLLYVVQNVRGVNANKIPETGKSMLASYWLMDYEKTPCKAHNMSLFNVKAVYKIVDIEELSACLTDTCNSSYCLPPFCFHSLCRHSEWNIFWESGNTEFWTAEQEVKHTDTDTDTDARTHARTHKTSWPESASELYRPRNCRLSTMRIEGATWSVWRILMAVLTIFWAGAAIFSFK
jgi:hypothetical protein